MKNNITGKAEVDIEAPAIKVWAALTNPKLIKKYFFDTNASSDWKVGSPITFTGVWEGKAYKDTGTILQVIPNRLLQYNYWSSMSGIENKPENYVVITYSLYEENITTTLTVTQENIPDEKMKEHAEQNWRKVLDNLKQLLEKKQEYAVV